MSLDAATRAILVNLTQTDKDSEWDSAWLTILNTLFPSSQYYAVFPKKRNGADGDLIMRVAKVTLPTSPSEHCRFKIVLIVEVKDPRQWDSGKDRLLQQLQQETDLAFKRTPSGLDPAKDNVYWIATIGPHWQYGEKRYI
jgi:hypothetical protein